jgi:hypothetical protein
MVTPVEAHIGRKTLEGIKNAATYLWKMGKRIATLEERVTALEEQLKNGPIPADACPYCGERALRLTEQSRAQGSHPKRWIEEYWTCGKCGKEYTKHKAL